MANIEQNLLQTNKTSEFWRGGKKTKYTVDVTLLIVFCKKATMLKKRSYKKKNSLILYLSFNVYIAVIDVTLTQTYKFTCLVNVCTSFFFSIHIV